MSTRWIALLSLLLALSVTGPARALAQDTTTTGQTAMTDVDDVDGDDGSGKLGLVGLLGLAGLLGLKRRDPDVTVRRDRP